MTASLTQRQQREQDYHREHAKAFDKILDQPFSWDVLNNPQRRWWNAYWAMFAHLQRCDLKGKQVLVVGCGFGDDALRLAKMGAHVTAFDLSAESLQIAQRLALREGLQINFAQMPAEQMRYADNSFDCVLARDILHHVDIPQTMQEILRVAKHDALFVVNEIYSHAWTEKIRRAAVVDKLLYPRMRGLIYGPGKPYITADERKLSEGDLRLITQDLQACEFVRHFNFVVTRLVPDRFDALAKIDHMFLRLFKPLAPLLCGRVLMAARFAKPVPAALAAPPALAVA